MSDYVDGELDASLRKRVERHVRFCSRCHTVLGNLRQTLVRLRGLESSGASREEPDAVAARIAERWRERT